MNQFWVVNKLDTTTSEILIYGYIGMEGGITANDFVKELKATEKVSSKINLRINCGGGSIFEGLAIFNAIRNSTSEITGYIDGLAASMGSVIAIAPKKVFMSKSAMFMTHRASGVAIGNAKAMRTHADLIESLESTISALYSQKTGLSQAEAKKRYLGDDKWFTANEALQEKIIDGIYDAAGVTAPKNKMNEKDLVGYYNSFMSLSAHPSLKDTVQHSDVDKEIQETRDTGQMLRDAYKDKNITTEQMADLREKWGGKPEELKIILDRFAQLRINFLMNLDYEELDKKGLLNELKDKFNGGFQIKHFLCFGREFKGKALPKNAKPVDYIDYKELLDFAVKWKYIDQITADAWLKGHGVGDNMETVLKAITDAPLTLLEKYEKQGFDLLDKNGGAAFLKEFSYPVYREKFYEFFGVYPKENK